jgi:hypothetical protein
MRRVAALVAGAMILVGASACSRAQDDAAGHAAAPDATSFLPSHLTGRYADGRIHIRYPETWSQSRSERFGVVFADNSTRHSGFVSVKYLPDERLPARADYPRFAAEVVRPGGTLIPLYTQAARIGGLRGIETAFIWPMSGTRGPLIRAVGFDRGRQGITFLVFATERPQTHARDFAWIRQNIVWHRDPRHEQRRPMPGGTNAPGY